MSTVNDVHEFTNLALFSKHNTDILLTAGHYSFVRNSLGVNGYGYAFHFKREFFHLLCNLLFLVLLQHVRLLKDLENFVLPHHEKWVFDIAYNRLSLYCYVTMCRYSITCYHDQIFNLYSPKRPPVFKAYKLCNTPCGLLIVSVEAEPVLLAEAAF